MSGLLYQLRYRPVLGEVVYTRLTGSTHLPPQRFVYIPTGKDERQIDPIRDSGGPAASAVRCHLTPGLSPLPRQMRHQTPGVGFEPTEVLTLFGVQSRRLMTAWLPRLH